jgi:hypothetical protein
MNMVFNSVAEVGNATWYVIPQGTGNDAKVTPDFGDGILAFNGTAGSVSRLYTKQLDLSQTVQPNLSFWYFEDTIPCLDYMDVRVTIDGGATYTTLFSLKKYNPWYSGWRQYSVDLPTFAVNQCVFIVFEAMEKDRSGQTWQYIDRIRMTAKQDVELAEIIVNDLNACDLQNKEWKVILKNNTDPVLDYSTTPININLEILETNETFTVTRSSGVLGSFAGDTIVMASNYNFAPATYTLKAYYTSVLDDDRENDTLRTTFVVKPHLQVVATKNTTAGSCFGADMKIQQEVDITNDGTIEMTDFVVIAEIYDGVGALIQTVKDTVLQSLQPTDNLLYTMQNAYTVPSDAMYNVQVFVQMLNCGNIYSDSSVLAECVDLKDLAVYELLTPSGTEDVVGSEVKIKVRLKNYDPNDDFNNVVLHAIVTADNSEIYNQFSSIAEIQADNTFDFEFPTAYTVPQKSNYNILIFVESVDTKPFNDTMNITRHTNLANNSFSKESIQLSQNQPNPASNTTKVEYSLPHDGKATFNIYTTAGQVIYTQSVDATVGKNNIIFDLNGLSSGIYFYSMEFEGQKLVRKMSVK